MRRIRRISESRRPSMRGRRVFESRRTLRDRRMNEDDILDYGTTPNNMGKRYFVEDDNVDPIPPYDPYLVNDSSECDDDEYRPSSESLRRSRIRRRRMVENRTRRPMRSRRFGRRMYEDEETSVEEAPVFYMKDEDGNFVPAEVPAEAPATEEPVAKAPVEEEPVEEEPSESFRSRRMGRGRMRNRRISEAYRRYKRMYEDEEEPADSEEVHADAPAEEAPVFYVKDENGNFVPAKVPAEAPATEEPAEGEEVPPTESLRRRRMSSLRAKRLHEARSARRGLRGRRIARRVNEDNEEVYVDNYSAYKPASPVTVEDEPAVEDEMPVESLRSSSRRPIRRLRMGEASRVRRYGRKMNEDDIVPAQPVATPTSVPASEEDKPAPCECPDCANKTVQTAKSVTERFRQRKMSEDNVQPQRTDDEKKPVAPVSPEANATQPAAVANEEPKKAETVSERLMKKYYR